MSTPATHPDTLLLVPCHALLQPEVNPDAFPEDYWDDVHWVLQDFQKGEPPYYIEHIEAALDALAENPDDNYLIFSGGFTRGNADGWSEAASYYAVAERLLERRQQTHLLGSIAIEEYARDSFENVAFAFARFRQLTDHYAERMHIFGWKFKEERFIYHAKVLGITGVTYEGVRDPKSKQACDAAMAGEEKTMEAFAAYPFGDGGKLQEKRDQRSGRDVRDMPYAQYLPSGLLVAA